MKGSRIVACALATVLGLALATPAAAQDYTVNNTSGKYVTPPATGTTTLTALSGQDDRQTNITLPFAFSYYGRSYNAASVCTNGFMQFGGGTYTSFSNQALDPSGLSGSTDGIAAIYWDDLHTRSGAVLTWTAGSAPNRVFYISWENVGRFSPSSGVSYRFQAQLHESSGKLVVAHTTTGSYYTANSYTVGIDEYGGSRFTVPEGYTGTSNNAFPPDFEYIPDQTRFTGRVTYDEILNTEDGVAQGTRSGQVPVGLAVELQGGGNTLATGYVNADGTFSVAGLALVSSQSGSLHLSSSTLAARVSASSSPTSIGPPTSVELANSVDFGDDVAVGTLAIDDSNDSDGSARAAIQIALQMEKIRAYIESISGESVPRAEVFYQSGGASNSTYVPAGQGAPAYIRVGGMSSSNPDAFDPATLSRLYARHVETLLWGETSGFTADLDSVTSHAEAMSDGLGLYLYAMAEGSPDIVDGLTGSTAAVFDLESPDLFNGPAKNIAGWAGAAFYDLVDDDNESHDTVDGTSSSNDDRPAVVFGTFTSKPTSLDFVDAWIDQGYPAAGLVSDFIHHGLLDDDGAEPNDTMATAADLGTAGVRAQNQVLNRFNEDWYRITVPEDTDGFFVDIQFVRYAGGPEILLEVYRNSSLISTGTAASPSSAIRAATGPITAGPIDVRVAHIGGPAILDYDLQAFSRLRIAGESSLAWTVQRPLNLPLNVTGGIPPYTLGVQSGAPLPRGVILDGDNLRLTGSPQDRGTVTFSIQITDSGAPSNTSTFSAEMIVNAPLAFSAPSLTGVAVGELADVDLGRSGGTDPVMVVNLVGNMPNGLTIGEDYHIRGTATEAGGGGLLIEAEDVAGSVAAVDTTVVACGPFTGGTVGLLDGSSAAGFYFDALAGSTANLSLKTAKKGAKRDLDVLLISPTGAEVQGGKVKIGRGKASLKKVPLPKTGRYFLVFESATGPATELNGKEKVALPKKGKGLGELLGADEQVVIEIGALEGAKFQLKGKLTEAMEMAVLFILRPDGTPMPAVEYEQATKKNKYSLAFECTQSGTYTINLSPRVGEGGDFKYKFKIKQPKGVDFDFGQ